MNGTEETQARLTAALDGLEYRSVESADRIPVIEVERDALLEILSRLQERAGFETVTFVTAVDHLKSRTGGDRREIEPRFQVSIQLHSLEHEARIRVRIPVSSDDACLPSCTGLWPGANFMERECYDMFGIRFDGHPNLKRLLMPEGYGHHPLRKDFPHKGIEPDRLYREWDRDRRKAQAATEGEAR